MKSRVSGVVDLEIGDARRVLAHCAGVEARTEYDNLLATVRDLLIEPIVVIAGPQLDPLFARRKVSGDSVCASPRTLIEKQRDDWIVVQRAGFGTSPRAPRRRRSR